MLRPSITDPILKHLTLAPPHCHMVQLLSPSLCLCPYWVSSSQKENKCKAFHLGVYLVPHQVNKTKSLANLCNLYLTRQVNLRCIPERISWLAATNPPMINCFVCASAVPQKHDDTNPNKCLITSTECLTWVIVYNATHSCDHSHNDQHVLEETRWWERHSSHTSAEKTIL